MSKNDRKPFTGNYFSIRFCDPSFLKNIFRNFSGKVFLYDLIRTRASYIRRTLP